MQQESEMSPKVRNLYNKYLSHCSPKFKKYLQDAEKSDRLGHIAYSSEYPLPELLSVLADGFSVLDKRNVPYDCVRLNKALLKKVREIPALEGESKLWGADLVLDNDMPDNCFMVQAAPEYSPTAAFQYYGTSKG